MRIFYMFSECQIIFLIYNLKQRLKFNMSRMLILWFVIQNKTLPHGIKFVFPFHDF